MSVFNIKNTKLERILENSFKLEKEIQDLTEANLNKVLNLRYVKSEFSLNNFRIDTLAYKIAILNLGDIEIKPRKTYIAFSDGRNVVDILPQKNALKMWLNLNLGELDDPKGIARNVSSVGHVGNGDYEMHVKSDDDLEYILSLIKQSIKKNKK